MLAALMLQFVCFCVHISARICVCVWTCDAACVCFVRSLLCLCICSCCMHHDVCECVWACSAQEQLDLVCTSGRPFCLLKVRLMGPKGTPLEPGSTQVGEVQCRGPTVFKGYWQLPQASLEAFSDGWFCTGDLATINKAGYITVVDRIKDMILHGQLLPPSLFPFPSLSLPQLPPCFSLSLPPFLAYPFLSSFCIPGAS